MERESWIRREHERADHPEAKVFRSAPGCPEPPWAGWKGL